MGPHLFGDAGFGALDLAVADNKEGVALVALADDVRVGLAHDLLERAGELLHRLGRELALQEGAFLEEANVILGVLLGLAHQDDFERERVDREALRG